jgi:hypothetical protein
LTLGHSNSCLTSAHSIACLSIKNPLGIVGAGRGDLEEAQRERLGAQGEGLKPRRRKCQCFASHVGLACINVPGPVQLVTDVPQPLLPVPSLWGGCRGWGCQRQLTL